MPSPGSRLGFWFKTTPATTREIACSFFPLFIPSAGNNYNPFIGYPGAVDKTLIGSGSTTVQTRFLKYRINNNEGISISSTQQCVGCIGNSTSGPGILFDPTGASNYGLADYISPGCPWEGYSLVTKDLDTLSRNVIAAANIGSNSYANCTFAPDRAQTWLVGDNHYASILGRVDQGYAITQTKAFPDEPIIRMSISYTNTTTKRKLAWSMRGLDPDQDRYAGGSFNTTNKRGYADLPKETIVYAQGVKEGGEIIAIVNPGNGFKHNTAIISYWPTMCYSADSWMDTSAVEGNYDWATCGFTEYGVVEPGATVTSCIYYVFGLTIDSIYKTVLTLGS